MDFALQKSVQFPSEGVITISCGKVFLRLIYTLSKKKSFCLFYSTFNFSGCHLVLVLCGFIVFLLHVCLFITLTRILHTSYSWLAESKEALWVSMNIFWVVFLQQFILVFPKTAWDPCHHLNFLLTSSSIIFLAQAIPFALKGMQNKNDILNCCWKFWQVEVFFKWQKDKYNTVTEDQVNPSKPKATQ